MRSVQPGEAAGFGVATADAISSDIHACAKRVTETARALAGGEGAHSALLVLSDGLAGDLREVVRGSYRNAGQCSGLQAGGEGPRWEGRQARAVP